MWSDNESSTDLLQFKYLASSIVSLVKTPGLLPTTIGVFGDWGSGKSSLIQMVDSELADDGSLMRLTFNGWLFEGYEDAKSALMGSILDAIEERVKQDESLPKKALDTLNSLRKRVNWLQAASMAGRYVLPAVLGHPHISFLNATTDVAKRIEEALSAKEKDQRLTVEEIQKLLNEAPGGQENVRRNIRDFHKDFQDLLGQTKIKTLVVFIDDLDRCLPDTIIETLEAIKLFLFVPGTVFILGADERLIEYAVRQRFPELPGTEAEVGRDYLEKLVQIPVRIPPLSENEVQSYVNLLFAQLRLTPEEFEDACNSLASVTSGVSEVTYDIDRARASTIDTLRLGQLEADLDLVAQVTPILMPGLMGNPRRTKRFWNTLLLRLSIGTQRGLTLQRQVLAKLMLLEYLKPEFFRQLAILQASQAGRPTELLSVERIMRSTSGVSAEDQKLDEPDRKGASPKPPKKEVAADAGGDQARDELAADIAAWLADNWMCAWLASEPKLADVDLRPYFYVAHDKVGSQDGLQLRLSPIASDVLNKLMDPRTVTQRLGLSQSSALSQADASAVFQALARRVRQSEYLDDRSPHRTMISVTAHRPELLPQLVSFFASLPDQKIPLALPGQLYEATNGTSSSVPAHSLVQRWGTSSVAGLKAAAIQATKRPWKTDQQ